MPEAVDEELSGKRGQRPRYRGARLGNVTGKKEGDKTHHKEVQGYSLHQLLAVVPDRIHYLLDKNQKIVIHNSWCTSGVRNCTGHLPVSILLPSNGKNRRAGIRLSDSGPDWIGHALYEISETALASLSPALVL